MKPKSIPFLFPAHRKIPNIINRIEAVQKELTFHQTSYEIKTNPLETASENLFQSTTASTTESSQFLLTKNPSIIQDNISLKKKSNFKLIKLTKLPKQKGNLVLNIKPLNFEKIHQTSFRNTAKNKPISSRYISNNSRTPSNEKSNRSFNASYIAKSKSILQINGKSTPNLFNNKRKKINNLNDNNSNVLSTNLSTITIFKRMQKCNQSQIKFTQEHLPFVLSDIKNDKSNIYTRNNKALTSRLTSGPNIFNSMLSNSKQEIKPLLTEHSKEIRNMINKKCEHGIKNGKKLLMEIGVKALSEKTCKEKKKIKNNVKEYFKNKERMEFKKDFLNEKNKPLEIMSLNEIQNRNTAIPFSDKLDSLIKMSNQMAYMHRKKFFADIKNFHSDADFYFDEECHTVQSTILKNKEREELCKKLKQDKKILQTIRLLIQNKIKKDKIIERQI